MQHWSGQQQNYTVEEPDSPRSAHATSPNFEPRSAPPSFFNQPPPGTSPPAVGATCFSALGKDGVSTLSAYQTQHPFNGMPHPAATMGRQQHTAEPWCESYREPHICQPPHMQSGQVYRTNTHNSSSTQPYTSFAHQHTSPPTSHHNAYHKPGMQHTPEPAPAVPPVAQQQPNRPQAHARSEGITHGSSQPSPQNTPFNTGPGHIQQQQQGAGLEDSIHWRNQTSKQTHGFPPQPSVAQVPVHMQNALSICQATLIKRKAEGCRM